MPFSRGSSNPGIETSLSAASTSSTKAKLSDFWPYWLTPLTFASGLFVYATADSCRNCHTQTYAQPRSSAELMLSGETLDNRGQRLADISSPLPLLRTGFLRAFHKASYNIPKIQQSFTPCNNQLDSTYMCRFSFPVHSWVNHSHINLAWGSALEFKLKHQWLVLSSWSLSRCLNIIRNMYVWYILSHTYISTHKPQEETVIDKQNEIQIQM